MAAAGLDSSGGARPNGFSASGHTRGAKAEMTIRTDGRMPALRYSDRRGFRPRTAMAKSPIPISSMPIAAYHRKTCS